MTADEIAVAFVERVNDLAKASIVLRPEVLCKIAQLLHERENDYNDPIAPIFVASARMCEDMAAMKHD